MRLNSDSEKESEPQHDHANVVTQLLAISGAHLVRVRNFLGYFGIVTIVFHKQVLPALRTLFDKVEESSTEKQDSPKAVPSLPADSKQPCDSLSSNTKKSIPSTASINRPAPKGATRHHRVASKTTASISKEPQSMESQTLEPPYKSIAEQEAEQADKLINSDDIKYRGVPPFKGVKGVITSSASIITYKEIELRVTYFSATGRELDEEIITLPDVIPPSGSKHVKLKCHVPSGTAKVKCYAIGAVPVTQ